MNTVTLALVAALALGTAAQAAPASCPATPMRVTRSNGGATDYTGTVPGMPDLCLMSRPDGEGIFFYGAWRADWPGAGLAYPALHGAIFGPKGTRTTFETRAWPGLQYIDSFTNEGVEPMTVDGRVFQTLRLAHERQGIEGNRYHSVITSWRDLATGVTLRTEERQISGQSYGPDATWTAVRVERR